MNRFAFTSFVSLLALSGCTEAPADWTPDETYEMTSDAGPASDEGAEDDEVASAEAELLGNIRYTGGGTPFMIAQWERATEHARIVARTTAFEQCVRNTMAQPRPADGSAGPAGAPRYLACGAPEPNASSPVLTQAARLLEVIQRFDNDVAANLDSNGSTSASYQGYGTYDAHAVNVGAGFHESHAGWANFTGLEPWNFHVGTPIHEFLHTHDYGHLSIPECDASSCGVSECGWTRVCGGSGTPPASMNWSNAGRSEQNYCSWLRLGDDRHYATAGEPSAPYIASICAGSIFDESETQCGQVLDNPACGEGQLRLLTTWTGSAETDQTSTTCGCYDDPRHVVAFTNSTGHYLTAWGGGGSNVRTRVSTRLGPWQTFFAIEQNGSPWRAHDVVQLKSFTGDWVDGGDFRADRTTPYNLQLGLPSQSVSTLLGNGSNVAIRASTRYARDNGTELVPTTTAVGTNETFRMTEFDRSTIVYLRGDHGRFVNVDSSKRLWNSRTESSLNNLNTAYDSLRMASGFRLIDWNGGDLRSGDTVSLEALLGDTWHFVSTPSASGQMTLNHSVGTTERFVIRKVSGSAGSVIDHDDVVSFRSYNNHYISAMPSADSWQLTNAGTWEGPWQRFTLRMVQHHDRERPTW